MSLLRESIRKHLLLEKVIGQISTNLEVSFNLEIDRSYHSFERRTRPGLSDDYNQREIGNSEIKEIINLTKKDISEKIVNHELTDNDRFVIKSLKWEISIVVALEHNGGTYWTLHILTVFRESKENPFRVGKNQTVIFID